MLLRFVFGAALAIGFLKVRRPERPALRPVRRPRLLLMVSAAREFGAVVLLVAASEYVSTLVLTLVALAGTAVLSLVGRLLSLGSGVVGGQALVATGAVRAATMSVLASADISGTAGVAGVLLALCSTWLGLVASARARRYRTEGRTHRSP